MMPMFLLQPAPQGFWLDNLYLCYPLSFTDGYKINIPGVELDYPILFKYYSIGICSKFA